MEILQKTASSSNLGISQISEGIPASSKTVDEDQRTQQFEESFIFPLFSEISRVSQIPSIFCAIQLIIQIIQSLMANIFIGSVHLWKSINMIPKSLFNLSYIINFGTINYVENDFSDCWPIYLTVFAFIFIEIIFVLILLFYYRKKRLFLNWTLHLCNFLFSIINTIIFAPVCGIFGYAVWQVDLKRSNESIAFLVLSLISFLFLLALIVYNTKFLCSSIYLSRSIVSCWDFKVRNLFTITIGISSLIGPFMNPFAKWFIFVGFVIVLLINVYQLFLLHYLPYVNEIMNAFIQSSCVLSIISVVLSIAHYFIDINSNILIFVPVSIFVVSCVCFYFVNSYIIKSTLKKMDTNDENNTEENKKQFLDSINSENDSKIIFYIHIGVANMSPICVDYSLMKYIISVKQTPQIIFALIHLTAMIPAQIQFLSMVVSIVSSNDNHLDMTQKFILYQARKVNVTRQSVSSKEEISEAKLLYKMSEETISLVRGFWGEILHLKSGISTASLRYFRNAANRTSSSYLDAIEQYPRSQKIYDQYIRFLIEAKGDFKGSIQYRKNLLMIEKGDKVVHDYAFRSFANAFPKYLTDNIFDLQGMYIDKNDHLQANELNMQGNSTKANSSSSLGLSDSYHDDEISSTIFDHSKLRLSLQDVINKSSMRSLNVLRCYSIVSFLLIFLIMIILFVVINNNSDSVHDIVKSISLASKIVTSIQYAGILVGLRCIEAILTFGTGNVGYLAEELINILSINETSLPQEPSLFYKPYVKMNTIVEEVKSDLQEEMNIIYSEPSNHEGAIYLFANWSQYSGHVGYYQRLSFPTCNGALLTLSLRGIINMVIRQIESISTTNLTDYFRYNSHYDLYVNNCANDLIISDGFDVIFYNISQTGIDRCDRYSNIYDILTYVLTIVAVIIFFIGRLINFFSVIKEFRNLSALLQGFTKEDIAAASKPIYLKSNEPLPTGTVHSAHDFSIEVIVIPFLFLLMTADCIFVVVYSCLKTQDYYDTFSNVFEWAYGGAQRSLSVLTIINAFHNASIYCLDNYNANFFDFIYSFNDILQMLSYHNLIDMQIIGKDSRFDDFYYLDHCGNLNETFDYSDFVDCLSVSNKINLAINLFISIRNKIDTLYNFDEIFFQYEYMSLMYNIDKSIYNNFILFMNYLISFSENISKDNNNQIQNICIIGIIILFVLFIIENIFTSMFYYSLEGFKQLIYTLPPTSACRNRSLMLFLSNKKMKEHNLSTVDLVLESSQFSIITINENFIIQSINQEFCKTTDYSSQKLLGQSITYLIPLPNDGKGKIEFERSPFYSAINEMRQNTNQNDSYLVKVKIRKEDLSIIHMNANLIKLTDSMNNFKGVTLLLKSTEDNIELKNKLEQEKQNVNNLIQVLIPRGALNSVKGKKQSAFFKADEATLIFIEIIGMADCISMMTPKGILDILNQIYNGIDRALKKFKTISMIRWENEMIFAISGLFDNVGDFKKQSFETIAFLVEILQILEDTNYQANTDFHLRLGAHIDGPVIGFIQDPNNPCFDILSSSFKYLDYMKENGPIDSPQLTESVIKYLDLENFDVQKELTIVFDDAGEDVYTVKFKEGYKLPDEYIIDDDLKDLGMVEEEVVIDFDDTKNNPDDDDESNENIDENIVKPHEIEEKDEVSNDNVNDDESNENENENIDEDIVKPQEIEEKEEVSIDDVNDDEKSNENENIDEDVVKSQIIEEKVISDSVDIDVDENFVDDL